MSKFISSNPKSIKYVSLDVNKASLNVRFQKKKNYAFIYRPKIALNCVKVNGTKQLITGIIIIFIITSGIIITYNQNL